MWKATTRCQSTSGATRRACSVSSWLGAAAKTTRTTGWDGQDPTQLGGDLLRRRLPQCLAIRQDPHPRLRAAAS